MYFTQNTIAIRSCMTALLVYNEPGLHQLKLDLKNLNQFFKCFKNNSQAFLMVCI